METETARLFQLPDPHPSEPLVRPLQNPEANSIKQQWVIVGSDESGWMLEEIDGHYVGIRLAVFEEPLDCDRIIIEPQANLHSILDENRGRRTPYLISVDNALLVGLPVVQSERGAECQRIRLCVKVENLRVQHFRTVEPLGTSNRTFHRYLFEASAPVDQPQSREGTTGNRDIEYTRYHSLHWGGSGNNRGNNRASDKGFTKQDCRFFEGSPFLMCSVQPCGPCGGCKDYEVD